MCSISSKNSRFFVRTCDNSSLKSDRLSCLSIHILYHFFRQFALCGVALSNIALWGAALFVLHGFYGAVKERIRTAHAPRFASRGAETPRWGVSGARLGESLRARKKAHCNVLLQCAFWFDVILVSESLPAFGEDNFVDEEENHHRHAAVQNRRADVINKVRHQQPGYGDPYAVDGVDDAAPTLTVLSSAGA